MSYTDFFYEGLYFKKDVDESTAVVHSVYWSMGGRGVEPPTPYVYATDYSRVLLLHTIMLYLCSVISCYFLPEPAQVDFQVVYHRRALTDKVFQK